MIKWMQMITVLLLFMNEAAHSQTVSINLDSVYQTIEGFGTFNNIGLLTGAGWTAAQAYDTVANDLGVSVMRMELDPTYQSTEGGAYDLTGSSFGGESIEQNWNDVIALKALGVTKFFATVWSPPAWMKYNNNINCTNSATTNLSDGIGPTSDFVDGLVGTAGSMPNEYPNFAQFVLHYAQQFKSYTGINLYGIGLQNEPRFCESYSSSILNGPQWRDLISVVGHVLDSAGVPTKIIGSEDMGSMTIEQGYFTPIFEETNKYTEISRNDLGIFAVHGYLDGVAPNLGNAPGWASMYNECHKYGKELWMTETSGYYGSIWNDGSDTCTWAYAQAIYLALKFGKVSGWVWWQLAQNYNAANIWQALISSYNGNSPTKTFYLSKQYYRYVKPGAVQVYASSTDSTILPIAFWHGAQSRLTIILSNNSSKNKTVTLNMPNLPSPLNIYQTSATENAAVLANITGNTVLLPSYSVTTLYYQGTNNAPTINPVDDTTILMGTQLNITLTHISDGNNDNDAMAYTVAATSSDTRIIPDATPTKVNDSTYKLTLTPATDSIGTVHMKAVVTNTAETNIFSSAFVYFNVTIIPYINTPPIVNPISNVITGLNVSSKMQTVNITGINNGSHTTETNTIAVSSSNATVVRSLKVNYSGGSTGTITFYPLALGTDTVTVAVTNSGGTALGGNNTTIVKFTITVLSVAPNAIDEATVTNNLEVYPSPATDYIQIVIPDNSVKILTITDVTGRIVLEEPVTSDQITVNVSDLPSGIYFIIAKGDDKVFKSKVTIK